MQQRTKSQVVWIIFSFGPTSCSRKISSSIDQPSMKRQCAHLILLFLCISEFPWKALWKHFVSLIEKCFKESLLFLLWISAVITTMFSPVLFRSLSPESAVCVFKLQDLKTVFTGSYKTFDMQSNQWSLLQGQQHTKLGQVGRTFYMVMPEYK